MANDTTNPTPDAAQLPPLQGKMTIGNREIDLSTLSDIAKRQIHALRFAEAEISNLRMKLTLVEAGKQAVFLSLQAEVNKTHPAPAKA